MYRKLISNLAFSPSTIDQVSFYAQRLRQEESIRRLGFGLIIFSMLIQIFAAMVPPERSLAASNNDVIKGGVSNIDDLRSSYHNQADVKALFNHYGLTAGDIQKGKVTNTKFKFQVQGDRGTRTVGRINFSTTKDRKIGPFAGTNFYSRSAAEWQGSTSAYYFGKQKGANNKYYYVWVLKDCGNIAYRPTDGPKKPETEPKPQPQPEPAPEAPAPVLPPAIVIPPPPPPNDTPPPTPPQETPPPEITLHKSAINLTQKLDAKQTVTKPARSGDVIEYTLTASNTGGSAKERYVVEDYIGDIMDYADVDRNYLMSTEGSYSSSKVISWPATTLPAGGEIKKTFRVKLKEVLPSTNNPHATAPEYDCKMQNGYGDEVVIMVDCPVLKTIEALPNTGPGETIAAAFGVSTISGYFFMRSRLLGKEVKIIKKTFQTGDGGAS